MWLGLMLPAMPACFQRHESFSTCNKNIFFSKRNLLKSTCETFRPLRTYFVLYREWTSYLTSLVLDGNTVFKIGLQSFGVRVGEQGIWDGGLEIKSNDVLMCFFSMLKDLGTHWKLLISLGSFSPRVTKTSPCLTFVEWLPEYFLRLKESQRNSPFFFFNLAYILLSRVLGDILGKY